MLKRLIDDVLVNAAICGRYVEKIILSCLPFSTNVINSKRKEKRLGHTFVHALKPIKY